MKVERATFRFLDMPPFSRVTNRVDVIFYGAEPVVGNLEDDPSTVDSRKAI